jgi:hypothetical protein
LGRFSCYETTWKIIIVESGAHEISTLPAKYVNHRCALHGDTPVAFPVNFFDNSHIKTCRFVVWMLQFLLRCVRTSSPPGGEAAPRPGWVKTIPAV